MPRCPRKPAGFSLIELLIVIAVMGILIGLILPSSDPTIHDQLRSVARIIATDLHYGRSLAVANNSTYRVAFSVEENSYALEHSGADANLDNLPDSPFRNPDDPLGQHVVRLEELPHVGPTVRIAAVAGLDAFLEATKEVEYGPLGETTRSGSTLIWLAAGSGSGTRYMQLTVNPVTGLVETGSLSAQGPPDWLLEAMAGSENGMH